MAPQLRRAVGDDHLFIMAGWSKGTKQISEKGIDWLRKQNYRFPGAGRWIHLDPADYRYLDGHGYLYIKGEEYTRSPTQPFSAPLFPNIPLVPPGITHYAPPLLLELADNHQNDERFAAWRLTIKLDEWEESVKDALIRERAAAVGYYTVSETGESLFSSLSLRQIAKADYWPDIAPQKEDYVLYWQNAELYQGESRSARLLKEATPTPGLKTGWQGNVFFRFTSSGLQNVWKRHLPGTSIAASNANEFYWLVQRDQEQEQAWPGKAQRVGPPNGDWQLWHLHIEQENSEASVEWFWYRQIDVRNPTWRLSLLNPLSRASSEHIYTCAPGQQLLVRCDPPAHHTEYGQTSTSLALTRHSTSTGQRRPLGGSPAYSQSFTAQTEQYLRAPAPPAQQQYRLSFRDGVSGSSLWVQTTPLPTQPPIWLDGLRCSLTIAGKKRTMRAFRDEPTTNVLGSTMYALSVHKDFSLEQLAQATWSYQPSSGLPCSLRWEFLSMQGQLCREPAKPLSSDTALTNWWQNYIWPMVAESSWVKLTFDAASFGSITLMLHLVVKKQELDAVAALPEAAGQNQEPRVASLVMQNREQISIHANQEVWWTNPHYAATFLWLSRMVEPEETVAQQTKTSEISQALERLCVPTMPDALNNALTRLATSDSLPLWISLRLQTLLADIHTTFTLTTQERR